MKTYNQPSITKYEINVSTILVNSEQTIQSGGSNKNGENNKTAESKLSIFSDDFSE